MGSVENCVTVIAKVSMKCSTKVNEIERHLWQQNQKGFGGYRRLRGVFIKRSFRAVHLFFYRSEWPLSWLVWSIGRLSLYVVFWYRKKRTELLEGERRISSWYSAKGSVTTGTSHALEVDLNENEWNEQTLLGRWTRYQTTACARGSAKEKPVSSKIWYPWRTPRNERASTRTILFSKDRRYSIINIVRLEWIWKATADR